MSVSRKTVGNIRLEIDNQHCTHECNGADENDCAYVARTHECNEYKCKKENKSGAEVLHQKERTDTAERKNNVFRKAGHG